jgi:hypothetical protein
MLARDIDRVTASLHAEHPDIGRDAPIDVSNMREPQERRTGERGLPQPPT